MMMLDQMWGCVGNTVFSGFCERIRAYRELGKTRAGAQEITEDDGITGYGQKYGKYGTTFLPNITMTGVIRMSR